MDFFNIIIQFITVLFASVLGPIGLYWYKNKREETIQHKRVALKLYNNLQEYCFLLANSINEHNKALTPMRRDQDGVLNVSFGTLQWPESIPNLDYDNTIYCLDNDIIRRFLTFTRESRYVQITMESLVEIDEDQFIYSYCDFAIKLIENSCEISSLLEKKYKLTHSKESWLDLLPNRYKTDKLTKII